MALTDCITLSANDERLHDVAEPPAAAVAVRFFGLAGDGDALGGGEGGPGVKQAFLCRARSRGYQQAGDACRHIPQQIQQDEDVHGATGRPKRN